MKFKLTSEHLYWWPVPVSVPDPDPKKAGSFLKQEFRMQFVATPLDQAREEAAEVAALPTDQRAKRQHEQMLEKCRDWTDVADESGELVPFSASALASAMQMPWFRLAVYRAYDRSLAGDEARKGN